MHIAMGKWIWYNFIKFFIEFQQFCNFLRDNDFWLQLGKYGELVMSKDEANLSFLAAARHLLFFERSSQRVRGVRDTLHE